MDLGVNIRKEREKKGWTREMFAEKIGKSVASVFDWERGKSKPSIETLAVIAKVFDVTMDSLCFGEAREDYPTVTRHLKGLKPKQIDAIEAVVVDVIKAMKA